ncbi:MAG: hypothetical protein WA890_15310 [Micromonospora sp.]
MTWRMRLRILADAAVAAVQACRKPAPRSDSEAKHLADKLIEQDDRTPMRMVVAA